MWQTTRIRSLHTDNGPMSVHKQEWGGTMRKKTSWAASVVKKQLQTCCYHETLSLETTIDRDDFSEGFELPPEFQSVSPTKETTLPSLLRRKSFNVSYVKNLLTTPESQTPYRKSVESALPLFSGSTFKPRRLQYVKSSPSLVATSAMATPAPMPLPHPLPPARGAHNVKFHHKSGPLLTVQHLTKGESTGNDPPSPAKLRKHLSGPLPSSQRRPLSGTPSPPSPAAKVNHISDQLSIGGNPKQVGGGPSPNQQAKVKSSAQALFPAVATSKLAGMVTQGALKKAAQLAKVTPVLDRKGSRGSRASKVDGNSCAPISAQVKTASPKAVVSTSASPSKREDAHVAKQASKNARMRKSSSSRERQRVWAAVKIQAAFRGFKARKTYAIMLARADNVSGELTEDEFEDAHSVSTRMSRTDTQKRKKAPPQQLSKSWNGSLRTAQDCQALLRSKQEAALKRERALEYAMSRQHWKTGSRSQKGPLWATDDRLPDKPGWVWNWLERAARMGAHNSPNRIFDNDFENNEPQSESLSMKSTVGMCTTDIGSVDVDLGWPMTNPWPMSLRQQHAAGLLQPKEPQVKPSPLKKASGTPETPQQRSSQQQTTGVKHVKKRYRSELHELCKRDDVSTTADSCISTQTSNESSESKPKFAVRKLKFPNDDKQIDDQESVGSCAGVAPSLYRLSSPFAGPKTRSQSGMQHKMSNPNSLKEAIRVNPQAHGHHAQGQVSVALTDSDSAGTTAASVRRPFWRP